MKILQFLGWSLAFIVFTYVLICLLLYLIQERFIFYPTQIPEDYPFNQFDNFEEKWFTAEDGARIHALHFLCPEPRGIILYLHGNSRGLDDWGHNAQDFVSRNFEVLMMDYRGYGKSRGRLSEKAINGDVQMLYEWIQQKWPESKIVVYGRSLGTGPATTLTLHHQPGLLILETPYTSLTDMARLVLPYFPINGLLKYRFNNLKKIAKLSSPVHLFHGTDDELIPYRQAQRLVKKSGRPDVLTTIDNGMHNNLPDYEAYQHKLTALLDGIK
ncbi:MAG: alpha/beta fold hydrolase [Bacteroidota bacterium]